MRSTNGDEIVPCTEEEEERGNEEEDEEEERQGNEDGHHAILHPIPIQSTEPSGQKRSLRHGFSKLIASKRRKRKRKKNSTSDGLNNDSVLSSSGSSSRSQISSLFLPPCCTRPQYLPPDSPLSDHAFQSLIERNDFYSAECNVHQNLSGSTRNHGC